jgi:folate-dependent phosphoribosylglycinamide formyltransferase PurN
MNLLVICAGDRSNNSIALNCISHIYKQKKDKITIYLLDSNKEISKFANKNKIKIIKKNFNSFIKNIKKNQFDWLLNIWGHKILKKDFLKKFKSNLNLHPSYLPYNRGRDPYYFSIIDNTPIGVCIHRMDQTVDGGKYFIRKKIIIKFPTTAGVIFNQSLYQIKKLFLKNWLKIRNKKIKLKKFEPKVKKINKRKSFIKNNFLILDDKKNIKEKNFVLNCLAQDFPFLKQQIKLYGKIYDCKIILKPSIKKKW